LRAGPRAHPLLELAEIDLPLEHGRDSGEDSGADEAEHRGAEAEADPGGDEGEAEQGEELAL